MRVVLAWEFPLGALRWSRKSQMPCERGICEDRGSHGVCRDTPLPASGVAAVGHKITECSSMEILGRGLTMTTGPPSSTTLTKFAMLRDATAGTWFEDCGTHAQTSMATLATMSCWSSLSRISWPRGKRALCFGATECVSCQLGNLKFDDVLWTGGCRLVGKGHHHTSLHTPRAHAQAQSLEPFLLLF